MSTELQDREVIVLRTMEKASAEERDAYLNQACGDDAALRQEVEEMVAAQLQARNSNGNHAPATPTTIPSRPVLTPAEAKPSGGHEGQQARSYSRGLVTVLLLAVAGGGIGMAVWAWRGQKHAQQEADQAAEERDQAQKEAAAIREQGTQTEALLQAVRKDRDEAVASVRKAQRGEADSKDVLAFIRNHLLSAGRPRDVGGLGKDVTLRKAADAADAEVAKAFADRPLAEASTRVLLGSTYLDLEEPALAVKQLERALTLREKKLGPDNPATGDCRNKLAVAYRLAGRTDDAGRLYNRGRKALGDEPRSKKP